MRTVPNFGKKDSSERQTRNNDYWGCIWFPFVIIGGYIVSSAIARVNSHTGNWIDQIICYGTLICIVTLFALGGWAQKKEEKRLFEARQEWKRTCKSVEVAIMSRQSSAGGSYFDDYGDYHSNRPFHHLDLEPTTDQKATNPNFTVVTVNVYQGVYEKLEKRNMVRIYYKPEKPMIFLLEEEL